MFIVTYEYNDYQRTDTFEYEYEALDHASALIHRTAATQIAVSELRGNTTTPVKLGRICSYSVNRYYN